MPHNDAGKNAALSGGLGNAITHIGLLQLGDPGTGTNFTGTEATGGTPAYARIVPGWAAAAAGQRSNTAILTFDVPAGTYSDFLLMAALTGNVGVYYGYIPFGGASAIRVVGTVDAADVTANTITSSAHGMANTDRVRVYNVLAETAPAGLTEGTMYFVVGATTDTFQVSLTSGGAAVDITGIGEVFAQRVVPEVFAAQGQITVAAGALILAADGV